MIALVAAIADNNVIGDSGQLPWYLPEDLQHFRELTTGHVVIMGRNTFESILARLGRPLPNRTSVVLTKQVDYRVPEGVVKAGSLSEALSMFAHKTMFIIGGAAVYAEALSVADKLYITRVHQSPLGDVYFPNINWDEWKCMVEDKKDGFTFAEYIRG